MYEDINEEEWSQAFENRQEIEGGPTRDEKRILVRMLESSTLKPYQRKIAFEQICLCDDYETYQKLQYRLEELQPSIHEIPNPNQTDINRFLRKII
jgi:hypothetical protein